MRLDGRPAHDRKRYNRPKRRKRRHGDSQSLGRESLGHFIEHGRHPSGGKLQRCGSSQRIERPAKRPGGIDGRGFPARSLFGGGRTEHEQG
jgi:hypothetical protein